MSRFFAFVSVDLDVEDAGEVRLDDEGVDDDVNTGAKKEAHDKFFCFGIVFVINVFISGQ